MKTSIAVIGAGPSCLYLLKNLLDLATPAIGLDIFEKEAQMGSGMPYSTAGSGPEHITNISSNEIPPLVTSMQDWIATQSPGVLKQYDLEPGAFNEYKPLPRLLFGRYLEEQFKLLLRKLKDKGISVKVHLNTRVVDIRDVGGRASVRLSFEKGDDITFDKVIICSGHTWPSGHELVNKGWLDAPYPPAKISGEEHLDVAIRGSSLTAVDAIRTLAKHNGTIYRNEKGSLKFEPFQGRESFRVTMYSRSGFLPAVRFHFETPQLGQATVLTAEQIIANRVANEGFLQLDYVFEQCFKEPLRSSDIEFYEQIKDMSVEAFVESMLALREQVDAFDLLRAEYKQAEKSIQRKQSVYWKEHLASLSFVMNHPAKYFSAEDTLRLREVLMPLIAVVIAFIPQSSAELLLALHDAGHLNIVSVGNDASFSPLAAGGVECRYETGAQQYTVQHPMFIDCVGQPHLSFDDFPFKSLVADGTVSRARIRFRQQPPEALKDSSTIVTGQDNGVYLNVPGIAINDHFQVVDGYNAFNDHIFMMAVPLMGGFNPDYSGLDFCNAASGKIAAAIRRPEAALDDAL